MYINNICGKSSLAVFCFIILCTTDFSLKKLGNQLPQFKQTIGFKLYELNSFNNLKSALHDHFDVIRSLNLFQVLNLCTSIASVFQFGPASCVLSNNST